LGGGVEGQDLRGKTTLGVESRRAGYRDKAMV